MAQTLIKNALVIDGTNAKPYQADIIIKDDKIYEIGKVSSSFSGKIIDGTNKIICPGFIDIHTHSDFTIHFDNRAESQIRQGVTTQVVGLCGYSNAPLTKETQKEILVPSTIQPTWNNFKEYLNTIEENKTATNIACLVGHGTLRILAMPQGSRIREANLDEIKIMQNLLAKCFEEGAIGLSTGLEYFPGKAAKNFELLQLLQIVKEYNTYHSCHTKNRDLFALSSFTEIIEIAHISQTKLQISHVNCKYGRRDNIMKNFLTICNWYREEGVQIGMDVIPSIWNHANITALLPSWALDLSIPKLLSALEDTTLHTKLMHNDEPFMQLHVQNQWDKIYIFDAIIHKENIGKTIAQLSEEFHLSPWETIFKLLIDEKEYLHSLMFIGECFNKNDIITALSDPYCCVCSDSIAQASDGPTSTMRITPDSFTWAERFINDYTQKEKILSLQEAIYKLTHLPAQLANIKERGCIKENYYADLVLIDINKLSDQATFQNFNSYPEGIELVMVNGTTVFENGKRSSHLPGKIIKHNA